MLENFTMTQGRMYDAKIKVQFQPSDNIQVTPDMLLDQYAGQLISNIHTQLNKEISQQQLTNPLLVGWNVTNIEILSKEVTRSTNISDTSPILTMELGIIVDGTKAAAALTISVDSYTTPFENMTIFISAFFEDVFISPFVFIKNSVVLIAVDIYNIAKKTTEVVSWIGQHWKGLLTVSGLALIGILYLTREMKTETVKVDVIQPQKHGR